MPKYIVHWYTPDREAGPGKFMPAGDPYACEGGPLDGRQLGVVDPAFRLWYAMLPDGRWALATTDSDAKPEVIESGELRGHYVPEQERKVLKWRPFPGHP